MSDHTIIAQFNQRQPACIQTLKGQVLEYLPEQNQISMGFEPGLHCCHSVDIVQGGFVTAMLDAAMAHVVLAKEGFNVTISSIDINVSFIRPSRAGRFKAVGSIIKLGRTVGYLRAELFNAKHELTATATSSVHLTRHPK